MSMVKRRWTKEEEEILVQAVKANPNNLQKVFREVAYVIERAAASVSSRYYLKLKESIADIPRATQEDVELKKEKPNANDIQVKVTLKSSTCLITFTHGFNSFDRAKMYTRTLKNSVAHSDVKVLTTMYLNSKRHGKN